MRPLSLNIPLDVRLMNVTASFMFGGVCLLVVVMVALLIYVKYANREQGHG